MNILPFEETKFTCCNCGHFYSFYVDGTEEYKNDEIEDEIENEIENENICVRILYKQNARQKWNSNFENISFLENVKKLVIPSGYNICNMPHLPNLVHLVIMFDCTPAPAHKLNYDFIQLYNMEFPSLTTITIELPSYCLDAMNVIRYDSLRPHQNLIISHYWNNFGCLGELEFLDSPILKRFVDNVPTNWNVYINHMSDIYFSRAIITKHVVDVDVD